VEISARNLTSNVIRAFYNLLLIQRYVENLENVQRIEKESLSTAQKRQGTGRGQLLDVLQIKTQLALLEPKVAKAKNDASIASALLANYMATTDIKELRVIGQLDVNSLKEFASKVTFENMNLPEYKQIQMAKEKLEAEESATLGKNYPSVNLFANWGRASTKKSDLFDSNTTKWSYGIELDIPLFSGLSSIGQRRAFAARLSQWEQDRKAFEDNQSFNQIKSRQSMKLAEESIQASQEAFKFAEQSLAEAKRNFHYATIDFLQYLSVQKDYLEAASMLDQAKYSYIDALVSFFVNSGQNLRELAKMLEQRKS
jgi:outer membrane protein